jgi:hypothetical protein
MGRTGLRYGDCGNPAKWEEEGGLVNIETALKEAMTIRVFPGGENCVKA